MRQHKYSLLLRSIRAEKRLVALELLDLMLEDTCQHRQDLILLSSTIVSSDQVTLMTSLTPLLLSTAVNIVLAQTSPAPQQWIGRCEPVNAVVVMNQALTEGKTDTEAFAWWWQHGRLTAPRPALTSSVSLDEHERGLSQNIPVPLDELKLPWHQDGSATTPDLVSAPAGTRNDATKKPPRRAAG